MQLSETIGLPALRMVLQTALRHHAYDIESVRALHQMQRSPSTPSSLPKGRLGNGVPDVDVPQKSAEDYDIFTRPGGKEVPS